MVKYSNKKLSVIIPSYNEEKTIAEVIRLVKKVDLKGVKREIIVVDDGSSDNTISIVRKIKGVKLVAHKRNQGKGAAIRTGIMHATGDIILIQDADLEYDPNDYFKLIRPILDGEVKVVYGSRVLHEKQKQINIRFLKSKHDRAYSAFYIGGRVLTFLANLLYGAGITDEPTCYKVFDAKVLKSLNLRCKGFEFCPEVTAKVAKKGYRIKELPTPYYPRSFEEGKKINWKDGIEAVWTLIKYRFVD